MSQITNALRSKFIQLYIFTMLALLYVFTLFTVTHGELKAEVNSVMMTALGGILTLLGTVVNDVFGSKRQEQDTRATDGNTTTTRKTDTSTTVTNAQPKPGETK